MCRAGTRRRAVWGAGVGAVWGCCLGCCWRCCGRVLFGALFGGRGCDRGVGVQSLLSGVYAGVILNVDCVCVCVMKCTVCWGGGLRMSPSCRRVRASSRFLPRSHHGDRMVSTVMPLSRCRVCLRVHICVALNGKQKKTVVAIPARRYVASRPAAGPARGPQSPHRRRSPTSSRSRRV